MRLRFSKRGKVRFTSHRDVARMWERALRRVGLPVAYSEGFNPHPKLHFGLALSTGYESDAEFLDVDLIDPDVAGRPWTVDELPARLSPALPVGIDVQAAIGVEPGTPSLQQAVTSCTWHIEVLGAPPGAVADAVDRVLAATTLLTTRERKGQPVTDDLRPYLLAVAVTGPLRDPAASNPAASDPAALDPARQHLGAVLTAELGTQPRSLRPAELIGALCAELREGRVCRTHQWTAADGAREEPLRAAATSAPHAQARAS
ncbi:TIGR03936 family radical SAM-associated protein [soil metagenome]